MKVLETNRLLLRWLRPDDAGFILELVNDPAWLQFIGDKGVRTLEDARNYILKGPIAMYERYGFGLYLTEQKADGVPVGLVGLIKREGLEHVDIGFAFLPAFRSQGYAYEAASALLSYGKSAFGLDPIVAITSPDNERSKKLLEKLGMRFEKMLKLPGSKESCCYWTPSADTVMNTSNTEPYSLESLKARVRAGWAPKFLFFWGHTGSPGKGVGKECLSQWYPAPFTLEGDRYATAEHYMMAEKARLFGDLEAAARILKVEHPSEAKKLGRGVRGFDEALWKERRFEVVVRGSIAKFAQNPELGSFLKGTGSRVLVEASPKDTIWGIGLSEKNPHAQSPLEWRGLNLLGFALMMARAQLSP